MGAPRRKSLIALLAVAEDQAQNVYEPLQTMIRNGPLDEFVKVREGFIRLPNAGMIVPVTSKAASSLGARSLRRSLTSRACTRRAMVFWRRGRRSAAAWQACRVGRLS